MTQDMTPLERRLNEENQALTTKLGQKTQELTAANAATADLRNRVVDLMKQLRQAERAYEALQAVCLEDHEEVQSKVQKLMEETNENA